MNDSQARTTETARRISSFHLMPWLEFSHPEVEELWEGVDILRRGPAADFGWVFWREMEGGEYEQSQHVFGHRSAGASYEDALRAYAAGEVLPALPRAHKPEQKPKRAGAGYLDLTPELQEVVREFERTRVLQGSNWEAALAGIPFEMRKVEASRLSRRAQRDYDKALAAFRRLCPTPELRQAALALVAGPSGHAGNAEAEAVEAFAAGVTGMP